MLGQLAPTDPQSIESDTLALACIADCAGKFILGAVVETYYVVQSDPDTWWCVFGRDYEDADGWHFATAPGCLSKGATRAEAIAQAVQATRHMIGWDNLQKV